MFENYLSLSLLCAPQECVGNQEYHLGHGFSNEKIEFFVILFFLFLSIPPSPLDISFTIWKMGKVAELIHPEVSHGGTV